MIGNVKVDPERRFDGGDQNPGHWWIRLLMEDGSFKTVDLTACQFYKNLPHKYTDDPKQTPLFACVKGTSVPDGLACGPFPVEPSEHGKC